MIEALAVLILGSANPGLFGGCAVTYTDGYPLLECTYGALAECPHGELTCDVPIYAYDLADSPDPITDAHALVDWARSQPQGWAALGQPWMSARTEVITRTFLEAP